MRAAVYHGRRDLRVEEVPEPAAGPGELLLEVHAVGVCGTDAAEWEHGPSIYAFPGPHPVTGHRGPLIPGHELSGRVVALGEGVEGFEPGAVVACGAGYVLKADSRSLAGRPNLSRTYATVGLQRHGGLAQYVAVPAEICMDVRPYGLSEDAAALAQPLAIAVHSMRKGRLQPGEHALVIGAGGIGAFLIYAAAELGAHVTVADLSLERLRIATELGAEALVDPSSSSGLPAALAELGIEPQVVYEVTGTEPGLRSALAAAAPGGARLVLTGLHEQPREIDLRHVTLREIELIGTNAHVCGVDLPEAVRLLAARREGWADLAPEAFPLGELVAEGIAPLVERRAPRIKTLIDPWAKARRPADTVPR
jgi:(R,R)-butanediol dehydrogenase / meso-butanediol dehydrogenase / diacetyl reductase